VVNDFGVSDEAGGWNLAHGLTLSLMVELEVAVHNFAVDNSEVTANMS
jgi:hypothetical protein